MTFSCTGLILAALSWKFATWIAQSPSLPDPEPLLSSSSSPTPSAKLSRSSSAKDQVTASESPSSAAHQNPYTNQSLITKNHLEKRAQELSGYFSDTDIGRALTEMTVFHPFGPSIGSPESAALAEKLKYLESNPKETLSELQQSLSKIGPNYALDRQWLVQWSSQLNVDTQSKIELLTDELQNAVSAAQIEDQAAFNAPIALSTLLNVSDQYSEIEPAVRQAVKTEKSTIMKQMLISIYSHKNAEGAQKLRQEFGF